MVKPHYSYRLFVLAMLPVNPAVILEDRNQTEVFMGRRRDSKKFLKAVGNKLYSLRKVHKKELESVAKAIEISPALLMRIERGDYDIYLDLLFELCDFYAIAPHDFFKDVEKELKT